MVYSEIKKILKQLKKNEITVFDVPEEYENDISLAHIGFPENWNEII